MTISIIQDGKLVEDAQKLLAKLRDETVPGILPSHLIKDYSVEWGPGIDVQKHEKYLGLVCSAKHIQCRYTLNISFQPVIFT